MYILWVLLLFILVAVAFSNIFDIEIEMAFNCTAMITVLSSYVLSIAGIMGELQRIILFILCLGIVGYCFFKKELN